MKTLFILISAVLLFSCPAFAAESPKRIVSLAPSLTEIMYALGLQDRIVAVTTYCDYPEEARKKPKIGGMSNPSLEAVVAMKPDLVVMTTDGNPKEFQERLAGLGIRTYVFEARRLAELPQGIRELGTVLQVRHRAEELAVEIERNVKAVQDSALGTPHSAPRRKVLFIVWPEPLIVAGPGTVIDDVMSLLGVRNIAASAKTQYPKYSIEEVLRQGPDVLFIGRSMGMDMREVSKGVLNRMPSVPAVRNGKVYFVSDQLFRLGPRVVDGIREMKKDLQ